MEVFTLVLFINGMILGLKFNNTEIAYECVNDLPIIYEDIIKFNLKQFLYDIKPCLDKDNISHLRFLLEKIVLLNLDKFINNLIMKTPYIISDLVHIYNSINDQFKIGYYVGDIDYTIINY